MPQPSKGRIRLWLRSERALGLHALPVRVAPLAAAVLAEPARPLRAPAPTPPPPRPAPQPAPQPTPQRAPAAPVELLIAPEQAAFEGPVLGREERLRQLAALDQQVRQCARCELCQGRTQTVFGEGDVEAELFFIGEGPGEVEDRTGRPFVGPAGQKLDEMIAAMGLGRQQVYIGNIVKCRPPNNRPPAPEESVQCMPYLLKQVQIVRPKVIVLLGLTACKALLQTTSTMSRLRGQWQTWRGIRLMPTFHPSYILRNYTIETRKAVWSDLQKVMAELGLKPRPPARS